MLKIIFTKFTVTAVSNSAFFSVFFPFRQIVNVALSGCVHANSVIRLINTTVQTLRLHLAVGFGSAQL